tara:strand:+ start:397 stop:687 length:291 start_codon:yes stop_codon:yes gene_type:complete
LLQKTGNTLNQAGTLRWECEKQQPVERKVTFGKHESIPPWELTTSVEGEQKPGRWEEGDLATSRRRSGRCSSEHTKVTPTRQPPAEAGKGADIPPG